MERKATSVFAASTSIFEFTLSSVFDSSYSFKFSVETSDIKNLSLEKIKKAVRY